MPRTSICSCLISGISVSVLYACASDTTRPLVLASPPAPPPLLAVSLASVSWFLRLRSSSCCSLWAGGRAGQGRVSGEGGDRWVYWLAGQGDHLILNPCVVPWPHSRCTYEGKRLYPLQCRRCAGWRHCRYVPPDVCLLPMLHGNPSPCIRPSTVHAAVIVCAPSRRAPPALLGVLEVGVVVARVALARPRQLVRHHLQVGWGQGPAGREGVSNSHRGP